MAKIEQIRDVVWKVANARLDGRIGGVTVTRTLDQDDDPVLLVTLLVKAGGPAGLDARRASGLIRHLRPELDRIGERDFPVVSFVAESDGKSREPEAA